MIKQKQKGCTTFSLKHVKGHKLEANCLKSNWTEKYQNIGLEDVLEEGPQCHERKPCANAEARTL